MSAPASPSWYDVLGVDADADADAIRTAWREGIADLDPGHARFRSLNQAAEVLLDPERRRAYDAELAPATRPATTPGVSLDKAGPVAAPRSWRPRRKPRDPGTAAVTSDAAGGTATLVADRDPGPAVRGTDGGEAPATTRSGPPVWLLVPLAIVTALLVAAAAYLFAQPSDKAVAAGNADAQSAAEQAAGTILAYDYRQMDADEKASDALMTPSYAAKYNALFAQIKANAASIKPVVTVQVLDSGIIRFGDDRVQVLVFVNRPTTRADGQQSVFHDQVRMTMVHSGAGWLVDDLQTSTGD